MQKIHDILRIKYESKLSHKKIAGALGLSKGAVSKYISQAQVQGIVWPLPEGQDLENLERRPASPGKRAATDKAEPDYFHLHTELKRKGITLRLLWEEYTATHGQAAYRYSCPFASTTGSGVDVRNAVCTSAIWPARSFLLTLVAPHGDGSYPKLMAQLAKFQLPTRKIRNRKGR
uniref:HTH IS408-type domain-containing protein n=2 Tax=Candidatus Kentrum sp. MB TaxID=2138164 RepID=A0A450XDK7_9GAMM|nr:MAG: hypothetical protein BECKMB1821G_GA0114241_102711 [Candidatus Kentron sp. MB]